MSHRFRRAGCCAATVVALLAAGSYAAPAPSRPSPAQEGSASSLPALRQEAQRLREELDSVELELAGVEAAAAAAQAALRTVEQSLSEAEAALAGLEERLAAAQQVQDEAVRRLATADGDLQTAVRRLQRGLDQLAADKRELGQQLSNAYRLGTSASVKGMAGALTRSGNVTEFLTATDKLRFATHNQAGLVDGVAAKLAHVQTQQGELERRRRQRRADEATARHARDEVAVVTAQQRATVDEISRQRAERQELLATVEASRGHYRAMAADLEAQAQRLTEQLRRYRFVAGAPGDGDLAWPTDGRPTSGFGSRTHPIFGDVRLHAGIDIPAPAGQPIVAADAGRVVSSGARSGYGLTVVINHGNGMSTLYAHQGRLMVSAGQLVRQGDLLGYVGSTGQSTGPHLHFEVRVNGAPRNPLAWFRSHTG